VASNSASGATVRLSEYLVKGFAMDDERLKNPPGAGVPDYFDELLERIRDIRASERRVYLRVREIIALAADYQPTDADTQLFFQTIRARPRIRKHTKNTNSLVINGVRKLRLARKLTQSHN
jgi:hypothetical protein